MTSTATLVQLAAELSLFLVALAGAGLSARHGLLGLDRAARLLLVVGFLALAAGAFLVGSLAIDRTADPVALAAVRTAGATLVALGALRWAGSRLARPILLGGLGLLVVAALLEAGGVEVGGGGSGAEPLVLVASLVMGAALVRAGRRTISGRIGTSVAAVLLMVILLVSVALSIVISTTVEDEALRRNEVEADAEAGAARGEAEAALGEATLAAGALAASAGPDLPALAAGDPGATSAVRDALSGLVGPDGLAVAGPVVVVTPDGEAAVAVPADLGPSTRLALAGDPVVQEALSLDAPRQGVTAVGRTAFAVAAAPLRPPGDAAPAGVLVVARPLDTTFLRRQGDAEVGRALVTREGVVAEAGPQPPSTVVRARAEDALETDAPEAAVVADRLVVARPVASEGLPPEMALVVSGPTDAVTRTREDIYRSLFLVALAAGLAGMALATVVGERIGGGIRTLTAAAARIRGGDLDARVAADREDELGELSVTFDAMAGSVRTLTGDLRDAAEAEGRLRARLESVFAGVAEAVVAADDDGRVTEVNRAAEEMLGVVRDEARGRPLEDVVALDGGEASRRVLDPATSGTTGLVGEVRPADGREPVPVVGSVARLQGTDDAPAGVVVVLRDVRQEQALEAAKRDFLATIGHELRTPLTPIKGYAGVLRRRTPSPEQAREWADGITEGVTRLEDLVDRLVAFSALTAATPGSAARAPIDAVAFLDAVAARWRDRIGGDRRLEVAVAAEATSVEGDAEQLHLAVDELVDNAVRFGPPGTPVRLTVDLETGAAGDPLTVLAVHDEGAPDVAVLEAAVSAFRQGDGSTTRHSGGLGLGLALSARIAEAHGGRLRIDAPSRGGTSVSILVPVVTVRASSPAPAAEDPVADRGGPPT